MQDNWPAAIFALITTIICVLLILFVIGMIFIRIFYSGYVSFKDMWVMSFPGELTTTQKNQLLEFNPYYKNLLPEKRLKFEKRLLYILATKSFKPIDIELTNRMKLVIASTFAQLTFGYKIFKFSHFRIIEIHPDSFYSTQSDGYHRGEVRFKKREIVLAWNHFQEGYKNYNDGYNVGLHELAHALEFEHFVNGSDYHFFAHHEEWRDNAENLLEKVKLLAPRILRPYAATNTRELFAVCVESFFERSEEFSKQLPSLYDFMCRILNQDPRREQNPVLS